MKRQRPSEGSSSTAGVSQHSSSKHHSSDRPTGRPSGARSIKASSSKSPNPPKPSKPSSSSSSRFPRPSASQLQALQARVDLVLRPSASSASASSASSSTPDPLSTAALNLLLVALADAGETAALVRVWDALKARPGGTAKGVAAPTWAAVERLHSLGKKGIPKAGALALPPLGARALAPARRLHKICKGRTTATRSDGAKPFMAAAAAWLEAERRHGRWPKGSAATGRGRRKLADALKAALALPNADTARGVVTKLKQRKLM